MEKFIIGIAVGGLCGALLVANNYKMRALVKKGQEEVQKKLDDMLDEKLDDMEQQGSASEFQLPPTISRLDLPKNSQHHSHTLPLMS